MRAQLNRFGRMAKGDFFRKNNTEAVHSGRNELLEKIQCVKAGFLSNSASQSRLKPMRPPARNPLTNTFCFVGFIIALALVSSARGQAIYEPYTIATFAGSAGMEGSNDGTGSAARFAYPEDVAIDSVGNIYVADSENHTIRRITPNRTVTTFAGMANMPGSDDGVGSAARFDYPWGLAVDSNDNIYVAEFANNTIRKITPGGAVTTLAGLAAVSGSDDGSGSAARFYRPQSVAVDGIGNIYVADSYNNTIRKITPAGVVTTLAGLAGTSGSQDGQGNQARFNYPAAVAADSAGMVYVAELINSTIRKVTPRRSSNYDRWIRRRLW